MAKTYCILGGGGSFGIHTAFYLLDHAKPKKVIGVGRNPLRFSPFSLDIGTTDLFNFPTFAALGFLLLSLYLAGIGSGPRTGTGSGRRFYGRRPGRG